MHYSEIPPHNIPSRILIAVHAALSAFECSKLADKDQDRTLGQIYLDLALQRAHLAQTWLNRWLDSEEGQHQPNAKQVEAFVNSLLSPILNPTLNEDSIEDSISVFHPNE